MGVWNQAKNIWKKSSPAEKRNIVLRSALLVGGLCLVGAVGGPACVAISLGGICAYGAAKEYTARKKNEVNKALKGNGGRPLTERQKTKARNKALMDTLGMSGLTGACFLPQTLDEAQHSYKGRKKGLEATSNQSSKKVETKAFDFGNFINPQDGSRKF